MTQSSMEEGLAAMTNRMATSALVAVLVLAQTVHACELAEHAWDARVEAHDAPHNLGRHFTNHSQPHIISLFYLDPFDKVGVG